MFKLWSEKNSNAMELLSPNLELRNWNNLSRDEKDKIWHYLKYWFAEDDKEKNFRVFLAIHKLNDLHKYQSYAQRFLKDFSSRTALLDFEDIFFNHDENVVLELLSCFCKAILWEKGDKPSGIYKADYKSEEEYKKALTSWKFNEFDKFAEKINDVFEHFGVNLFLSRSGFVARQDSKITNEIYVPVLNFLSSPDWDDVNRELRDAFKEYQLKTEHGYSNCITHAVSALQAYLQVLTNGKIGGADGINSLVKKAQEKELVPKDKFSSEIFRNIDSILMKERGKTGDAHPKQEYANEESARLVLNLIMIFLQHCIQK